MPLTVEQALPDFDTVDIPLDEAPPANFEYACQNCGTELHYSGKGRKPKWCDKHKSGGNSTGTRVAKSGARNNTLALQAAAALTQVNSLIAVGLMVAPKPFSFPLTASALAGAEEGFNEAAYNALITDPKLCQTILKAGGTSGKIALLIAYGMLAGAVAPVAVGEFKANRE